MVSPPTTAPITAASNPVGTHRGRKVSIVDQTPDTLFDDVSRSDSRPGRHTEKSFHFLNRRAGAFWDRVRGHLESSYAGFPDEHKRGLVGRLRDVDERQHLPAWWELYTFTLFDRLRYAIEVHPELPGSIDKEDRPDFLVTKGQVSMYVEAAVVFNGHRDSDGWNWVCDCINDAKNPDFMVDVEIPKEGKRRPAARKIIDPLQKKCSRPPRPRRAGVVTRRGLAARPGP